MVMELSEDDLGVFARELRAQGFEAQMDYAAGEIGLTVNGVFFPLSELNENMDLVEMLNFQGIEQRRALRLKGSPG